MPSGRTYNPDNKTNRAKRAREIRRRSETGYGARSRAEISKIRDREGLPEQVAKERSCLACGHKFPSYSISNRICLVCTDMHRDDNSSAGFDQHKRYYP